MENVDKDAFFVDSEIKLSNFPILKNAVIADLHIHSRFSRATSKSIDIANLEKYARIKGVGLLGTGDFQHPEWFKELKVLEEREGILYTDSGFPFVWQTEISLMYSQGGKGRRVHHLILAPNKEVVKQITEFLKSKGRIDYDGRPIFGFSSIDLVDAMLEIDKDIEVIPAHAWTPWFGIFGSKSGFDSLKECFGDRAGYINAIETGLSSDPEMNWRLSELNNRSILSFSDLHSFWPWRLGREATIFSKIETYKDLIKQIRENSILGTVEVDPAYGKYHYDGHRLCNFSCSPIETRELKGICPKCGKELTVGVEYRVEELADQNIEENKNQKNFYKLLPLHELIALAKASALSSNKTWMIYNKLIRKFGNEFNVLLRANKEELLKEIPKDELLIELILKNREGKIKVKPGYDGVYGEAMLSERQEKLF